MSNNDETLHSLVGEYLDRLNDGERLEPEDVLLAHPELGPAVLEEIRAYLDLEGDDGMADDGPLGTLGDYTLRRQIGRGGMGVVYEAWESSMDRVVALKVLPPGVAADNKAFTRFMREAKTAGQLHHPNVVGVYSTGVKEGTPWYSMEYVEGETLAQVLTKIKEVEPESDTAFGRKDCAGYFENLAAVFADVADGLQHAHSKGVVHRDIKPSNLILDGDGKLRILDFGLARLEGQESLTLSGDLMGTVLYMSPEQAMAKRIPLDHRTDVYSLGATMYEMLTGEPPFRGKDQHDTLSQIIVRDPRSPRQLNPRVPKDLETIVLKCLRKDPGDRYGTAEAFAQDLTRFVRGEGIEARLESELERLRRRAWRHRVPLALAMTFVLLVALSAWLFYRSERALQETAVAEYGPAVLDLAVKLAAEKFSLEAKPFLGGRPGSREQSIRLPWGALTPITERDLRGLVTERARRSVREAAESLEKLTDELPERRDGHYHLARAYHLLGLEVRAREEARRTLDIDPGFIPATVLLQELDRNSADSALTSRGHIAKQARGTDRWTALWIRAHRAIAEERPGNWRIAAETLDELIELTRKRTDEPYAGFFFEAYLGRGVARLELGDFNRAAEDFAVAQDRAPTSLEPVLLRGKAYLLDEERELANSTFEELFEESDLGQRDETALWIAMIYLWRREYDDALQWADQLSTGGLKERLRSYLQIRREDWTAAIRAARKALAEEPGDVAAHLLLTKALLERAARGAARPCEEYLELVRCARRAIALDRNHDYAEFLLRMARETVRGKLNQLSGRNVMNTRIGCYAALVAALANISAANYANEIFDDFVANPDPFDCDPVCWERITPAEITPSPHGLLMRNTRPIVDALLVTREVYSGDVSVRSTASFNGTDFRQDPYYPSLPCLVHWDRNTVSGYHGWVYMNGELWIQKFEMGRVTRLVKSPQRLNFDPSQGDMEIELGTVNTGSANQTVELRVWPSGTDRPESPQFSITDNTHQMGTTGFGGYVAVGGSPVIIRSVKVITPSREVPFLRGDCNGDGDVGLSDAVCALNWLFAERPAPGCIAALNTNGDSKVDVADPVSLLNFLFAGGAPPVSPFPNCGPEMLLADKELGCANPPNCP